MSITVREYGENDIKGMISVWNEVVSDGVAFPQTEELDFESGKKFFAEQTCCPVATDENGEILGMYILHPNNVGRCGHICNASYESLGFVKLGVIPKGFLMKDGHYEDICPYYKEL